jgi:hypothetical protein
VLHKPFLRRDLIQFEFRVKRSELIGTEMKLGQSVPWSKLHQCSACEALGKNNDSPSSPDVLYFRGIASQMPVSGNTGHEKWFELDATDFNGQNMCLVATWVLEFNTKRVN